MDCSPSGSSIHGNSPRKYNGVGCHAILQGSFPTQVLNSGLHRRQILCCLAQTAGKARITGVSSPSLSQGIFLTQESHGDLLHCRRILSQLSYQGSPRKFFSQVGIYQREAWLMQDKEDSAHVYGTITEQNTERLV